MATKKAKPNPRVGARLLVRKPGETTFKPEFREFNLSKPSKDTPTDFTQITRRNASEDAKTQGTKPTRKPTSFTQTSKPATKKPVAKPVSKKPVAKPTTKKPVAKPTSSVKKPASYTQTSKPTGRSKIMINGRSR